MEKELILELNEIRKELEIPEKDFVKIVSLATMRRKNSSIKISDEMLYEIILDAMSSYDYGIDNSEEDKKNSINAIRLLLEGERKDRRLSDNMLFDFIEEYLDIIENNERKIKNPEELVERSSKSLGL